MDFDLTDEQQMLGDTAGDLLSRCDIEARNRLADSDLGFSREVWSQLAEIGILELGFDPEEAGALEIMVVQNEVGRRLTLEPIAAAALIPGGLIAAVAGDTQRELLAEVAAGSRLLAFAHTEPGTRSPFPLSVTTQAVRQGDSWLLTGTKNPVLAGESADTFVVSAALPDGGVGLFLVDAAGAAGAVVRTGYRTFDDGRGAQLDLNGTPAVALVDGDASAAISEAVIRWQSALCAEAVGAMAASLEMTTEYLKSRKQFGVPLSTFQTLTQRAADMYVSLELARSMNYYLAMSIADGSFDPIIAARAKLQISTSGRHIAQESIQLHGGIGVTAEYPIGHYAARLTAINQTLGSGDDHLHTLIDNLSNYETVTL